MSHVNWIIQGGQTGVDRGAWAAAKALRLHCGGYCPKDFSDENGIIPAGVRERMKPCDTAGKAARTKANVLLASALLVVAPSRLSPDVTPGTRLTLEYAATRPGLQIMVASSPGDANAVASWLAHLPPSVRRQSAARSQEFFLMVAGPRASIWPEGEQVTLDLLVGALRVDRLPSQS